jgi:pimeloyl-ACP methyl ester carboxylesterase
LADETAVGISRFFPDCRNLLQTSMRYQIEPPGQFLRFDGLNLHVVQFGAGVPVIFETGSGEWSSHWSAVMAALGKGFHAIAYDRAGLGWSDPARGSRSASVLADELLGLLDALDLPEPAIIAAHSYGASIARLAASRAPARFRGIVFVDGWHEAFGVWEKQTLPPTSVGVIGHAMQAVDRIGLFRWLNTVLNRRSPPAAPWKLPNADWVAMLTISNRRAYWKAALHEAECHAESDGEVAAVTRFDMPIIALVVEQTISREQMPKAYPVEQHNAAWREAAARLAILSERSETRRVAGTDHQIQLMRPEVVARAIRDIAVQSTSGSR